MACILCASSLEQYASTSYMELPVYYCKNCDLYSTGDSEVDVKKKLLENYKESQWIGTEHYEVMLKSDYSDPESKGKRRQWTSQYTYCKEFLEGKNKILEIGSGAGQAIYWFEEKGFLTLGIEPDKRSVESINKRLKRGRCQAGFAEEVLLDEKFDIIWISHVFEHLIRPDLFLEKYQEYLNDGGIVFIEVPNCENEKILEASIDEPSTFHFSKAALENVGKKAKFRVVKSNYFRSPTRLEGGLNKIAKKTLGRNFYPYYPKIITNGKCGTDIRIILTKPN